MNLFIKKIAGTIICSMVAGVLGASVDVDDWRVDYYDGGLASSRTVTLQKYIGSSSSVTIPTSLSIPVQEWDADDGKYRTVHHSFKVTSLGTSLFSGNTTLKSVTINAKVDIPSYAFSSCTSLASVSRLDNVSSIGDYAFSGCGNLTGALDLTGVKSVGNSAFGGCTGITGVRTSSACTSIGDSAFVNCTSLEAAEVDGTGLKCPHGLFRGCGNLRRVVFGDGVAELFNYGCDAYGNGRLYDGRYSGMFLGCGSLDEVIVGSGVTKVPPCFGRSGDTSSLRSVTFRGALTEVGISAFEGVGLEELRLTFAESVVVGDYAFSGCPGVTRDSMDFSRIVTIGSYAFKNCTGLEGFLALPGAQSVGNSAFGGCAGITGVAFSSDLVSLGSAAFANCSLLTEAHFEGGVPTVGSTSQSNWAFANCASGARGYYLSAYAAEWKAAIDASGKWQGLIMKPLTEAPNCPVKPPAASDALFVAESGGSLGLCKNGKSTVSFPIAINRVFGDIAKQGSAFPAEVTMRLMTYGADASESCVADEAWVNGVKVGSVPRTGDWYETSLTIPTPVLHLRQRVGECVNNVIEIRNPDSTGDTAITAVAWASIYIPAPPPVVVIHGINDSAPGMVQFGTALEDLGLAVDIAETLKNYGWDGIKKGGEQVAEAVREAKRKFGVEHVNLICHSMGGLKAREYVHSIKDNADKDVLGVYQIATPNGGSPLADDLVIAKTLSPDEFGDGELVYKFASAALHDEYSKGWVLKMFGVDVDYAFKEAAADLTCSTLFKYNRDNPLVEGLNYRVLAGAADWIVPVASAHTMVPHYSSESPVEGMGHGSLVSDKSTEGAEVLKQDLLCPLTADDTGRVAHAIVSHAEISGGIDNSILKWERDGSFHVWEGEEKKHTIIVSGDGVVRITLSPSENVIFDWSLKSPSGAVYRKGSEGVLVEGRDGALIITIPDSESGLWVLSIGDASAPVVQNAKMMLAANSNEEKKSGTVYFLLSEEPESSIECSAWLTEDSVCVGGSFTLVASAKKNGIALPMTAKADCLLPDGRSVSCVLARNDDGTYSAQIPANVVGSYPFTVSFVSESGVCFSRKGLVVGRTHVDSKLSGEPTFEFVDSDTNGLYDVLRTVFPVHSSSSMLYRVEATLADAAGREVLSAKSLDVLILAGDGSVVVDFDGARAFDSKLDAPYHISEAKLMAVSEYRDDVVDEETYAAPVPCGRWQFEHERDMDGQVKATILESATTIGAYMYCGCSELTEVTIPAGVTSIGAHAFDGCSGLTTVYVREGDVERVRTLMRGAGVDTSGLQFIVADPIPALSAMATRDEVLSALEGSMDARLKENITDAVTYGLYRDWAVAIGGASVKSAANAWVSFAVDSKTLLSKMPTNGDLKIDEFKSTIEPGKFDFTVSVKDVMVGSNALADNLKKVFELEGASSLDSAAFDSRNVEIEFGKPENGKLRFTAKPNMSDGRTLPDSFFMKMMIK